MSRLTKGIFGYETDYKKTPLNLVNNQTRVNPVVYTAGWYNIKGERLGCGDLTLKDLLDISKKLHSNESFIVMSEADSIWNLPKELDRSAPGVDYISKHMCWLVAPGTVMKISSEITTDIVERHTKDGMTYIKAGRKAVCNVLFKKPKPAPVIPVPDLTNITQEQLDALKKQIAQIKLQQKTIPAPALAKTPAKTPAKINPFTGSVIGAPASPKTASKPYGQYPTPAPVKKPLPKKKSP